MEKSNHPFIIVNKTKKKGIEMSKTPTNSTAQGNPSSVDGTGQVTKENMDVATQRKEILKEISRNQFVSKGAGFHRAGGAPKSGTRGTRVSPATMTRKAGKTLLKSIKKDTSVKQQVVARQAAASEVISNVRQAAEKGK